MSSTFAPGVTATVRLLDLKDDGVLVTALGETDSINATVFARNDQQVGSVYTSDAGDVTGDGLGNWTVHITTPLSPGEYYVRWDIVVGAHVGIETYSFHVRRRTG
jgi:methionine-rich copper-binding protein CopC